MSAGPGGRLEGRHALWKFMRSPTGSVSGPHSALWAPFLRRAANVSERVR